MNVLSEKELRRIYSSHNGKRSFKNPFSLNLFPSKIIIWEKYPKNYQLIISHYKPSVIKLVAHVKWSISTTLERKLVHFTALLPHSIIIALFYAHFTLYFRQISLKISNVASSKVIIMKIDFVL